MGAKPLISIVTPTFNQVHTLDECMLSVLQQDGLGDRFDLQYIVVDGGSTDGSVKLIESRRDSLHWFRSGEDGGPYDAVNRGFDHADGEILSWLNGDDKLCPWALATVASIFSSLPECQWLTSRRPIAMDSKGQIASVHCRPGFSNAAILRGAHHPRSLEALPYIQQESTFFSAKLWDKIGKNIDTEFKLAGDFDLWVRMAEFAELDSVPVPLGMFRCVAGQRSSQVERYEIEASKSLQSRRGISLPPAPREPGLNRRLARRLFGTPLWADDCPLIERDAIAADEPQWTRTRRTISNLDWSSG
ncbi:MAG: glycosyltransferase family 2 protein [Planctomycetota bacterium]